jgi:hypothetical protein
MRIEQRHLAGESERQIARAENCGRSTVARVVNGPALQGYLQEVRQKIWGGIDDAADVVLDAIRERRDAKLAFQLLVHSGVVGPHAQEELTADESFEQTKQEWMLKLETIALERHQVFGTRLPEPLEAKIRARMSELRSHGERNSGET